VLLLLLLLLLLLALALALALAQLPQGALGVDRTGGPPQPRARACR
jgi:hypothetical protein